jgi:hypothetical protein
MIRVTQGRRILGGGLVVFAFGVGASIVGMDLYRDAYAWVVHTYDVRLVIGRAIVHSGPARAPSCDELRSDIDELAHLTEYNPVK